MSGDTVIPEKELGLGPSTGAEAVIQRSESDEIFIHSSEGQASKSLVDAVRDIRLGGELKDFGRRALWISLSYLISGWYQYQGEIYKVTGIDAGEDPLKFPGGVESISFPEELIEAGTFAAGGAIGMLYFSKFMRNREGERLSQRDEAIAVFAGSFLGNAALSALGGLAHELVGLPDFPTLEYIQKIIGG